MKLAKINGKQVNLLIVLFIQAGIRGQREQLEWLEYQCGVEVTKFEDLYYGPFQLAVDKLKRDFNLE